MLLHCFYEYGNLIDQHGFRVEFPQKGLGIDIPGVFEIPEIHAYGGFKIEWRIRLSAVSRVCEAYLELLMSSESFGEMFLKCRDDILRRSGGR